MRGRLIGALLLCVAPLAGADPSPPRDDYKPLTAQQRWETYGKTFVSPGRFAGTAARALNAQIGDKPPEWGQGLEGFSRRAASSYALFAVQGTTQAAVAAAVGQDPRYLPCRCRGFWKRFGFAVSSTVLAYDRNGYRGFGWGRVSGRYAGSMAEAAWFPERYSWKDGLREGTQRFSFGAIANLLGEFGPDIKRAVGLGK